MILVRRVLVLLLLVGLLCWPPSASAQTWKQWDRARVNTLRAQHGLGPLVYRRVLQVEAQRWAQHEATVSRVIQNYNTGPCWSISSATQFGDNAGAGSSVRVIQLEWEQSPSHRANMLDRGFRYLGIGVVYHGTWVFMDQVFCG